MFTNKAMNLFLIFSSLASPSKGQQYLRRTQQQQICTPVNDVQSLSCDTSLFILLEVDNSNNSNFDEDDIVQVFTSTYNSMIKCSQHEARRKMNEAISIPVKQAKEQEDDTFQLDPSIKKILLEIDMSCNSCSDDYWQVFNGTQVNLDSNGLSTHVDNACECNGPNTLDFVSAFQDNIEGNSNTNNTVTIVNATQIPLLYPNDDDNRCNVQSETTFGYQGVCPGSNDDEFSCMLTTTNEPTSSPTPE